MIVQCAKCGTKFRLDEAKIGPKGAKVRCAKCQFGFIVTKPPPVVDFAGPTAVGPAIDTRDLNLDISLDTTAVSDAALPPPRPKAMEAAPTEPFGVGLDMASAATTGPLALDFSEAPTAVGVPTAAPSIHNAETAIYQVPAQFRAKQAPPAVPETAADGLTVDIDLDADELPPRAATPASPADAESPPEVDDSMLVDDADVTALAPPTPAAPAEEVFADPFAGMAAISVDGSIESPAQTPSAEVSAAPSGVVPAIEEHQPAPGRNLAERPVPEVVARPSAADEEPSRGLILAVRVVLGLLLTAALALGVLTYLGGGRTDFSMVGLAKPHASQDTELTPVDGVALVSMRSVLYPVETGRHVLVFTGTAQNHSPSPQKELDAVAELVDRAGRVIATERAPLGLALGPAELASLSDRTSVQAAFLEAAKRQPSLVIPSGAAAPFTVVIVQPPLGLESLIHRVRLEKGAPFIVPAPKPAPEPVVIPTEPEGDTDLKLKGKKALKAKKGLKGKGKRKAKAVDAAMVP